MNKNILTPKSQQALCWWLMPHYILHLANVLTQRDLKQVNEPEWSLEEVKR